MKKGDPKNKKITIDDLALMVQGGFTETNGRIEEFKKDINYRFDTVEKRFDTIENHLLLQHTKEIEHLRDKVLQLEVKFASFTKTKK